jgi:hypothetical protein
VFLLNPTYKGDFLEKKEMSYCLMTVTLSEMLVPVPPETLEAMASTGDVAVETAFDREDSVKGGNAFNIFVGKIIAQEWTKRTTHVGTHFVLPAIRRARSACSP